MKYYIMIGNFYIHNFLSWDATHDPFEAYAFRSFKDAADLAYSINEAGGLSQCARVITHDQLSIHKIMKS